VITQSNPTVADLLTPLVDVGGEILRQPPCRLGHRQPQTLDVDVPVRQARRDRLEAADRPVELFALTRVDRRELQCALEHAEQECAEP
jgi:hypothetical protein